MKTNFTKLNQILMLFAAMMVLLSAATKVQAVNTYTFNAVAGSWNVAANWTETGGGSGGIPGIVASGGASSDIVVIPTAKSVNTLGSTAPSIATLTIGGTGSLNIDSSSTLNVSGVFTMGNASSGACALTNNGALNLNGTGSSFVLGAGSSTAVLLTNTAGSIFTCAGGNSANANPSPGPIFGNNGTATFTGATTPFGTGFHAISVVQGSSGILNLNNSVAAFANSATLNATAVGNTVNYGFAGTQSAATQSGTAAYYNLTLSGSGAKSGNATVSGTLSLQGTATYGGSATYVLGATLEYKGTSAQTATANEFPSTANLANLTINNSAGVSLAALARTINGTLTLTSGALSKTSGGGITMGNGATISRAAGSLSSLTPTFGTSVNVIYNDTSSTTTGSELPTSTTALNNLTISNLAGIGLNANAKVNGTFAATYNGSTVPLAAGANTLTFASSPVNITVSGSSLAATTYTIVSSSSTTVSGTLGTLTVSGAGAPYSPTPTASDSSGQLILTIPSSGPTPVITGATTTTSFTTTYGTASANQSFAVSGVNLTGNLVAAAGTGFQVATASGGPYGSSVSFTPTSGSASGTVYVELSPTAAVSGTYNSVNAVVLSSTGAINQNITTPSSGNSVAMATPTVTVNVGSYTYTGSAQGPNTVTTSTTDTGTVTWSYVGVSGTTYGPSTTLPTSAGSYTATATVTADSNNNSASSSATAFTITTATPTVTVTVGTYIFNGSPEGPNAVTISTTDTGTVTWSYVGTGSTSYGPSSTQPTALGTYTATATVAADSNDNLASSIATAFSIVTPTPTAYTFNVPSGAWNNSANWTPTGVPGQSSGDSATIPTGDTVTGLGGTTVSITNLTIGGTGSLNIDSSSTLNVSGTFTMGNSSSGICVLTNNGTLNLNGTGSSFVMGAGSGTGSVITNTSGSIFTCAGGNSANANAVWIFGNNGTATFTGATIPFDTGFHNAAVVQGPNGILNLNNSVAAFGNSATLNATAVGNTVNYGFTGTQSVATQSGTATYYNLTLSGSGSKSGNATISANGTLSLQGTATYGGSATYGAGATLVYAGSAQQTSGSELPSGGVPNLTINNASGVLLGGNSSVSGTLTLTTGILNLNGHTLSAATVTRTSGSILLTPTVTLNNKVYDGTTAATTIATRSLAGTLTGDTGNGNVTLGTSGTVSTFSSANVGSYTPSVTGLALSGTMSANYSLSTTSVSPGANITKATASVTITPYSVTYDGLAHTALAGTVTGVNGETGATVGTVTLTSTTHTAAGTYASDSWTLTGGANYNNITAQTITDTIGKATASVTVTPYNVTYDGNAHTALAGTVTGVNGETGTTVGTVVLTGTTHTAAGTYASDSWSLIGGANYTNIPATTITDTIGQAPPSLAGLSSMTNSYGVTNIVLIGTLSASGSVYPASGEIVSATINGFSVNGSVTDGTGDFSITYNDPSLATNDVAGSPYTITYSYSGNANLVAATDTTTSLAITNAPLSITANNDSKCFGDTKTYGAGSTAFSSTGLMNGETIGTVTIVAGDSPSGTGATDSAGTHDLTPSAATGGTFNANNYLITYVNGTLTVNALPTTSAITGPNNVAPLSTETYSVTGTAGSTYNWTVPSDATFTGGTGNSINVTFGSTSDNVSVIETSSSGCTGTPQTLFVTVNSCTTPTIVGGIDPDSTTLCAGSPLILTLTNATGPAPLFYQWQTNGADILDATNASYTNLSVTLADMTNYVCIVSNSCGSVTSLVATVTVNPLPTVSVNSASICAGDSAVLTATTSASSPTYLWNDPANSTTASIIVSPSATTTYTVTLTDGTTGCANTGSGTVVVNSVNASNVTYNATIGFTFKVAVSDLLTHASGTGGVTLTAVQSPSSNGVTVTNSGGEIYYFANVTNTDTFTYTVASVTGGCTATGTVTINPIHPVGTAKMGIPTNGVVTIQFFGIPGTNYVVETATNITFTPYWPLSTNTAGSDGSWQFMDPNATNQQQYYRSTWQP